MPIYEFQCQACGTEIEVLQKISDPHITDCEACGKAEMKKKVTAAAFRLSGAGWYETDFKAGDNKKNLSETNSGNKDQKSTDGKKDNKGGDNKSKDKTSTKNDSKTTEKSKPKETKAPSTD